MTPDELEKHAKAKVNEWRKACKLRALGKLKKGVPGHSRMNTLALSLEDVAVVDARVVERNGLPHVLLQDAQGNRIYSGDEHLVAFLNAYNDGAYPKLSIPPSEVKVKYPGDRKATVIE